MSLHCVHNELINNADRLRLIDDRDHWPVIAEVPGTPILFKGVILPNTALLFFSIFPRKKTMYVYDRGKLIEVNSKYAVTYLKKNIFAPIEYYREDGKNDG